MCWCTACLSVVGFCKVIFVPVNTISRMQILLDIPHGCGWFVGAIGLIFSVYWFDSHSCTIPLARSPLDIVFDSVNWFMLMPVAWYVALANSLFPRFMRSMKASRRVCSHPHSMVVSSLRLLGGSLSLNVGQNSRIVSPGVLTSWRCALTAASFLEVS